MTPSFQTRNRKCGGFSLLELLTVVVIVIVLTALVTMGFSQSQRAYQLSKTASLLHENLQLARQTAIARNECITVSFCETTDSLGNTGFHALILSSVQPDGTHVLLSKPFRFPPGFGISTDPEWSSLLTTDAKTIEVASETLACRQFRFQPSGGTDLAASGRWFLTVHHTQSEALPDANFITLILDPVTGSVFSCQP